MTRAICGIELVIDRVVFLIYWNCGVVVQSLGHEHLRQFAFLAGAFLDFRSFILEPDFDLVLVEAQLICEIFPPLFG